MKPTDILLHSLPPAVAGVGAALIWGDKQALSPDQYALFSRTGTLHLAVLSGQNITLLAGALFVLIKPFAPRLGYGAALASSLLYLILFPNEPPVVRAAIMGAIGAVTLFLKRPAVPLFALCASVVILLGFHPYWYSNISFLLSVGATGGIAILYPHWYRAKLGLRHPSPLKRYIISTCLLSLAAQAGIVPIILLVFRTYTPISIVATTAVCWLIEPIMLLGLLTTLTGYLFPMATGLWAGPLSGLLWLLLGILKLLSAPALLLTLHW